jgi:hypothetical protein
MKSRMFAGMTQIPDDILGIPIRFDANYKGLADSRGLWRWKSIVIGVQFLMLGPAHKLAVLYHEACHCLRHHMEKRVIALPMLFIRPAFSMRLCAEQEMEADAFAAANGYGKDLLDVLTRFGGEPGTFYPSNEERVTRLTALIRRQNESR